MNIRELMGKRILAKTSNSHSRYVPNGVEEYKILEVSPSGHYIKLQNIYGNKFWKLVTEFQYLETLTEFNLSGEAI